MSNLFHDEYFYENYNYSDERFNVLPNDKLNDLFIKYINSGKKDKKIKQEIMEHNIRLVLGYLNKNFRNIIGYPIYHDMFQEGCVGLLMSIDTFDPNHGNVFSTYAIYQIKRRTKIHYLKNIYSNFLLTNRDAIMIAQLNKLINCNYTDEEIINKMNITPKVYKNLKKVINIITNSVFIDSTLKDDKENERKNSEKKIGDNISDVLTDDMDSGYKNLLNEEVKKLLDKIFNDKTIFKNDEWLFIYKEKILNEKSALDIQNEINISQSTVQWRFNRMNDKVKEIYGDELKFLLKN